MLEPLPERQNAVSHLLEVVPALSGQNCAPGTATAEEVVQKSRGRVPTVSQVEPIHLVVGGDLRKDGSQPLVQVLVAGAVGHGVLFPGISQFGNFADGPVVHILHAHFRIAVAATVPPAGADPHLQILVVGDVDGPPQGMVVVLTAGGGKLLSPGGHGIFGPGFAREFVTADPRDMGQPDLLLEGFKIVGVVDQHVRSRIESDEFFHGDTSGSW